MMTTVQTPPISITPATNATVPDPATPNATLAVMQG